MTPLQYREIKDINSAAAIPDTKGKLKVEEMEATIPMIEKLNATVSISWHINKYWIQYEGNTSLQRIPF